MSDKAGRKKPLGELEPVALRGTETKLLERALSRRQWGTNSLVARPQGGIKGVCILKTQVPKHFHIENADYTKNERAGGNTPKNCASVGSLQPGRRLTEGPNMHLYEGE